jgi:hypothetical protein
MKLFAALMVVAMAGCSPVYESGKTKCSDKRECPSGFVCLANGYCADSSGGGNGGSGGTIGGSGGVGGSGVGGSGGTSGGSGVILTGSCAGLTCLATIANMTVNCNPGGTCTESVTALGTLATVNECYGNGVEAQVKVDENVLTSGGPITMQMTVKNGGSFCYAATVSMTSVSSTDMTMNYRNASGAAVGTVYYDSATGDGTVTCPGGTPTTIDSSCGVVGAGLAGASSTTTSTCTQGTCTY